MILNQIHENNLRFLQIQEDHDVRVTEIMEKDAFIEDLKFKIDKLENDLTDKIKVSSLHSS